MQTALGAAVAGETIEVGQGTYYPTSGTDRTATFQLIDGVSILGGFAGYGSANPDARNVAAYPTILSGDIGMVGNTSDNSFDVVTGSNTNSTAVLDGFTVSGGNSDESGGGIFNHGGNPTINDCTFTENWAIYFGGGMFNDASSPTLTNCTFSDNSADNYGGGIYNSDASSPTLTNCIFSENSADLGGGVYDSSASPTMNGCIFNANTATFHGGAMENNGGSSPMLMNCMFNQDSAGGDGGGMFNYASSSPILTNCTFYADSTSGDGGALYNGVSTSPTLTNCKLSENKASSFGDGGGMYNSSSSSPTVVDCTFSGDSANEGGGIFNDDSSPTLASCAFSEDSGFYYGGGILNDVFSSPTLTNCTFNANTAGDAGGGVYDSYSSFPQLANCCLWGDSARSNSEIFDNDTIYPGYPSLAAASNSDIQGGFMGTGNINADPLLVNAVGGNLQVQSNSPCINAGSNAAINATGVTMDIAGNPRIVDGVVDMGAYEVQAPAISWTGLGDGVNWSNANNWSDKLVPTQSDSVTIPSGVAKVQVGGSAYAAGSINASSPLEILGTGALQLFGASVLNSSLAIDSGGILDIQQVSLTINYPAGADPASTIRGYLKSASAGGIWTGTGLTSSVVEAQVANAIKNPGGGVYALGYLDGAVDIGQTTVTGNQIVIEPTIVGDTDLNGTTNFFDLGRVAQNLGTINSDWYHGDFNYDGTTNFLDIGLLAQNLNKSTVNTPLGLQVSAGTAVVAAPSTAGKPSPARPLPSPGVPGVRETEPVVIGVWASASASEIPLFAEDALADLLA